MPPGEPKVVSPRAAKITFLIVLAIAALGSWWVWLHWHSLLVVLAPLLWIFESGRRWRKRNRAPTGTL